MIAGLVLGILVLLCIILLCASARIRVVWGPGGRSIEVRYLGVCFRPSGKRRKKKDKRGKRRKGGLGWVKLVPELLQAGGKGLKFLLCHSELRHLRIEGRIGTEDAANTGVFWGIIQAAYGTLQPWASKLELAVAPDFDGGDTHLALDGEASARLAALLAAAVIILWDLPKGKMLRLLREGSKRKKASQMMRQEEVKT